MKAFAKTILIYGLLVILPTTVLSIASYIYYNNTLQKQSIQRAGIVADLYRDSLDRFVGDSLTTIETLALVVKAADSNTNEIEQILKHMHEQDPRFSGLYYSDSTGHILFGSNSLDHSIDLSDRPYIQEVLKSKKTTISSALIGRVLGQRVSVIVTPVFTSSNHISGLVMASLRLDYATQLLKGLTTPNPYLLLDKDGSVILQNGELSNQNNRVVLPIARTPWEISVYPLSVNQQSVYNKMLLPFLLTLFLSNGVFILTKYWMLRKQAKDSMRENEQQKINLIGTLAASTAHEIRNPLTGIKGLVTLLSEKHRDDEDRLYFSVIQKEIQRINQIVSEFLILGKPTAIVQSVYDLRDIIMDVTPIMEAEANQKGVTFLCIMEQKYIPILCSNDHIKQVLFNLSKNAIEAMDPGGQIRLEVGMEKEQAKVLIIDNGVGIPIHVQERIFDPFFTSKENGTGLGLVICKRIIDLHGGNIHITSKDGVGTTVELSFPLNSFLIKK
ncbi:ATP-binding protein [Ectobacillus sp. sgz5001026]|uniref:ATP-binding protein n=1 Tax=Ectobacillus sp. sgz5001026 TaxID=3242473 RepID=UPI0036D3C422